MIITTMYGVVHGVVLCVKINGLKFYKNFNEKEIAPRIASFRSH